MVRIYPPNDIARVYFTINEATKAYEEVIPADCYRQPYMPMDELEQEMKQVILFGCESYHAAYLLDC